MDAKELGRRGEDVATGWLQARGLRVLERNWRGAAGELDVVALDGACLVGVEVKTRAGEGYGHPAEAVTPQKLARLHRLIAAYARDGGHRRAPRRVDVVGLIWPPGAPAPTEVSYYAGVTP